jgi:DNA (cytosine-5)-methyltransferase 1
VFAVRAVLSVPVEKCRIIQYVPQLANTVYYNYGIVGNKRRKEPQVIDLFCGVGGLTHGFVREGFKVLVGYDSDASCKFAYESNNAGTKFIHKEIEKTESKEIAGKYRRSGARILVGCAPCQPFSLYTVKQQKDEKWKLLLEFQRLIADVRPEVISMENVPELSRHPVFQEFVIALSELGYHVSYSVVFCPDYGVPQSRKRLVLFGSRFGQLNIIKKTHPKSRWRTVRKAIARLAPIKAGERSLTDRIHQARKLDPTNLERIRSTPAGGSWSDWPKRLQLDCHLRSSGKTYRSIYGRMKWDMPAPTLTTHCTGIGNGRYGHPDQDRAISLREAALLQSFPRGYKFVHPKEKVHNKLVSRHVGNAVPVRLGRVIARSIRKHLEEVNLSARQRSAHKGSEKRVDGSRQNERHRLGTAR